jgi:hypothetical protein
MGGPRLPPHSFVERQLVVLKLHPTRADSVAETRRSSLLSIKPYVCKIWLASKRSPYWKRAPPRYAEAKMQMFQFRS